MKKIDSWFFRCAVAGVMLGLGYNPACPLSTEASENQTPIEIILPGPEQMDTVLEESISMRKSHRMFTGEPVTDEELSTVLWSACGMRDDGTRTVAAIDGKHGANVYVLKQEAVYKYISDNHTLVFFGEGDRRICYKENTDIYKAPVQILLCCDIDTGDVFRTAAEIGEIGQAVYLSAGSLGLGTVATAQSPYSAEHIGLPENEAAIIMMPLGHLKNSYSFIYQPFRISTLDALSFSEVSISKAIQERTSAASVGGTLSRQEKSQLIWSSWGFSPLRDRQFTAIGYLPRHRNVPCPHYTYDAVRMYVIMEDGVYRYNVFSNLYIPGQPVFDFLEKVAEGDQRDALAQACSNPSVAGAPLSIIPVLDVEQVQSSMDIDPATPPEYYWPYWYFTAGASAHNMLLEATALGLAGTVTCPVAPELLLSLLGLDAAVFHPMLVVSVGSLAE